VCHVESLYGAQGSPNLPELSVVHRENPEVASPRGQPYRQPLLFYTMNILEGVVDWENPEVATTGGSFTDSLSSPLQ